MLTWGTSGSAPHQGELCHAHHDLRQGAGKTTLKFSQGVTCKLGGQGEGAMDPAVSLEHRGRDTCGEEV